MQILPKTILLVNLFLSVFSFAGYGQFFEGELLFIKETTKDTSFFSYKVKGDKVRFEELNKNKQLENYIIADLRKKNIYSINPKRKLYIDLKTHEWTGKYDTLNMKAFKTGNHKIINGITCYQWRIQNKKEDTEISYWLGSQNFPFFADFHKILNNAEKTSQYYLNIPSIHGFLPFESAERSMMREFRMRFELIRIEKKSIQASTFEIPQGYKIFRKN